VQHGPSRARSGDPLRDGFFELLVRSHRVARKQGKGLAVYRSCADWAHRLCGERWAQHTIFPAQLDLVRRFLRETRAAGSSEEASIQLSLMANPWAAAWTAELQELERADFAAVSRVEGAEHLKAALQARRGVVCAHYHTLFAPLFWTWLRHADIAPGVLIREWVKSEPTPAVPAAGTAALAGARELKSAIDSLRGGGMVQVMADGYQGKRKSTLVFCNRLRGFETTFIELATMSAAPILPVVTRFTANGSITFEIGRALADDARQGRSARTESLLRQFVTHLERHWRAHPADISWFQMNRHLALPAGKP
jgi:lauroyl/myristoyl acyltransferase